MPNTHEILVDQEHTRDISDVDPVKYLRQCLEQGQDWPSALLEAMALWTTPFEVVNGRKYAYFIGGEAFDWLLLAERLCEEVGDMIPYEDKENLLYPEHDASQRLFGLSEVGQKPEDKSICRIRMKYL